MLIIIRINYASEDLKIHFEGGAEGYSRGFYSTSGAGVDGVNGDRWHSVTGSPKLSRGSSIFRVPLCQCSVFCDLHLASGNRNTKRKGRSVTDRQPLSQLIFGDLIDNKTNNLAGGSCFLLLLVWAGAPGTGRMLSAAFQFVKLSLKDLPEKKG